MDCLSFGFLSDHPSSVSSQAHPLVAGILGGIGSGKSAVAQTLSGSLNALVIDADRIGHDVLHIPEVRNRLRQCFGEDIFKGPDIDRQALARRVFGPESQHREALNVLESIVHPEIGAEIESRIKASDVDVVILDAAVLLEAGWRSRCDVVVFVDVPFEIRLARIETRGWTEEELKKREASQIPLDHKRAAADLVVDNSGSLDHAVHAAVEFLKSRLSQSGAGSSDRSLPS